MGEGDFTPEVAAKSSPEGSTTKNNPFTTTASEVRRKNSSDEKESSNDKKEADSREIEEKVESRKEREKILDAEDNRTDVRQTERRDVVDLPKEVIVASDTVDLPNPPEGMFVDAVEVQAPVLPTPSVPVIDREHIEKVETSQPPVEAVTEQPTPVIISPEVTSSPIVVEDPAIKRESISIDEPSEKPISVYPPAPKVNRPQSYEGYDPEKGENYYTQRIEGLQTNLYDPETQKLVASVPLKAGAEDGEGNSNDGGDNNYDDDHDDHDYEGDHRGDGHRSRDIDSRDTAHDLRDDNQDAPAQEAHTTSNEGFLSSGEGIQRPVISDNEAPRYVAKDGPGGPNREAPARPRTPGEAIAQSPDTTGGALGLDDDLGRPLPEKIALGAEEYAKLRELASYAEAGRMSPAQKDEFEGLLSRMMTKEETTDESRLGQIRTKISKMRGLEGNEQREVAASMARGWEVDYFQLDPEKTGLEVEVAYIDSPTMGVVPVLVPKDPIEKWRYINRALVQVEKTRAERGGPGIEKQLGKVQGLLEALDNHKYIEKHANDPAYDKDHQDSNLDVGRDLIREFNGRLELHGTFLADLSASGIDKVFDAVKSVKAGTFNVILQNSRFRNNKEVRRMMQFFMSEKNRYLSMKEVQRGALRQEATEWMAKQLGGVPEDYAYAQMAAEKTLYVWGWFANQDKGFKADFTGGAYFKRRLLRLKEWFDKNAATYNLQKEIYFPPNDPKHWLDLDQNDFFSGSNGLLAKIQGNLSGSYASQITEQVTNGKFNIDSSSDKGKELEDKIKVEGIRRAYIHLRVITGGTIDENLVKDAKDKYNNIDWKKVKWDQIDEEKSITGGQVKSILDKKTQKISDIQWIDPDKINPADIDFDQIDFNYHDYPLLDWGSYNLDYPEKIRAKTSYNEGSATKRPDLNTVLKTDGDWNYLGAKQWDRRKNFFVNTANFLRHLNKERTKGPNLEYKAVSVAIDQAINIGYLRITEEEEVKKEALDPKFIRGLRLGWAEIKAGYSLWAAFQRFLKEISPTKR